MILKSNHIIEKRNILNEMRPNNMSLVEMRFFSIYLSKINARKQNTRVVCFPLSDFIRIMEINKVNIMSIREVTEKLLKQTVCQRLESGGFVSFQLFKSCKVDKDRNGDWVVEIDAHDQALPLMFEFKRDYFKYALWNELRLKSTNQMRMYEILKQYEFRREKTLSLVELKFLLGIPDNAYPKFSDFRRDVLDTAKRALMEETDIIFMYDLIKKGRGDKVISVHFKIEKNENFVDQLAITEFIDTKQIDTMDIDENTISGGFTVVNNDAFDMEFLAEAFANEFTVDQVEYLYRIALPFIQKPTMGLAEVQHEMYDYFLLKYSQLKAKGKGVVRSRFGLLRTFIESDAKI